MSSIPEDNPEGPVIVGPKRSVSLFPWIVFVTVPGLLLVSFFYLAGKKNEAPVYVGDWAEDEARFDVSINGFIDELSAGYATATTHRFDDYTTGSYHVEKPGLLDAVSRRDEFELIYVGGPLGAMWSYDILCVVKRHGKYQLNRLIFTHARIFFKGMRKISDSEFTELRDGLIERVQDLHKVRKRGVTNEYDSYWALGYREGKMFITYFDGADGKNDGDTEGLDRFVEPINRLVDEKMVVTYLPNHERKYRTDEN